MKKVITKIASEKLTSLLCMVVIFQLAILVYFLNVTQLNNSQTNFDYLVSKDLPIQRNYYLSSNLFPEKIQQDWYKKLVEFKVRVVEGKGKYLDINPPTKQVTSNKTKDLVKKQPIPTPSPYSESFVSTIEGRDADRELLTSLLADRISEYYFTYGKYPNIYINKSKTELTDEGSNILYFYNVDENRTNALAIVSGDKEDSYKFARTVKCDERKSKEDEIVFIFDETQVVLCKEDGSTKMFGIMK